MSSLFHPLLTLDQPMDDVPAVLDAVVSNRAALFGISEGVVMASLFAATYPARTAGLIINGSYPSRLLRPGYPWGIPPGTFEQRIAAIRETWGDGSGMDA